MRRIVLDHKLAPTHYPGEIMTEMMCVVLANFRCLTRPNGLIALKLCQWACAGNKDIHVNANGNPPFSGAISCLCCRYAIYPEGFYEVRGAQRITVWRVV